MLTSLTSRSWQYMILEQPSISLFPPFAVRNYDRTTVLIFIVQS